MFYVKSQLDESTTLLTEITDENVFTRCPDCGQEVSVDLNDVIDDEGQLDLFGMPVWNLPRVICCAEYRGDFLVLPRGCFDDVMNWMQENCISVELHDERRSGRSICASFNGELRDEQTVAFEALSAHDTGVLSATTAFGKTVIGAALIAEKKVSTLILVHRAQLMEQWKERLAQFLAIDEVLPPQPGRRGRQKKGNHRLLWRKQRYPQRDYRYCYAAIHGQLGGDPAMDS